MYKIREIKYSLNTVSIQVYRIENRKRKIIRHIGTASNEEEKINLIQLANDFIKKISLQFTLFDNEQSNKVINLEQSEFIGVYYVFFYELLHKLFLKIGFDKNKSNLLLDLVVIRLFEPASKLRSIELLELYFGVKHRRQSYYESAKKWLDLKEKTEKIALSFAKKHYNFNYDLLFYDVTTLYFETFDEDELRKNGFSKDNKSQQPQILIALMVSKEGFPIAYEVFSGNTFEGHTFIPVIKKFIDKNSIKKFTVVADAAMISTENVAQLNDNQINYIVGARLGNITKELFKKIDAMLIRKDGESIRIPTNNGFLICNFSSLRYRKDKYEMEKQILKAKQIIENPSKIRKTKFTKSNKENHLEINQSLIDKTKKLLGIKGYYTNLNEDQASNDLIIDHYHQLYKIEQNFRIAKSDLQTRPIFHFKEEPIKLHILLCFMALLTSRYIELETGISIKKFIHECKKITDGRILNKITNTEIQLRVQLNPLITEIIHKLKLLT
ncbi:MAG: IS1634 family transposase [Crocinitomix sp.]|nr:IS1634 family transposase [Crocinitomix sp.]